MSDRIKHECGVSLVRLLKPLDYYKEKYGTPMWGLDTLQLLMQKQRNRGQDGAGVVTIKLNPEPGTRYISLKKSPTKNLALTEVFDGIHEHFKDLTPEQRADGNWLKANKPYTGEVLLGHLRYATHGANTIEQVHPFLRQNNWISRNLVMAGNFNLTNVEELFEQLLDLGQHPKEKSDTVSMMEKVGHFLDKEVDRLFHYYKHDGHTNREITKFIEGHLNVANILKRSFKKIDGGYVMAGIIGHGDAFVVRDPNGIRPAFYYQNDEVFVLASERAPIMTALDIHFKDVEELPPGHAAIVKADGRVTIQEILEPRDKFSCSFERIYFSRGNDRTIYTERKKLGELLAKRVLEAVDYDFEHTIFSYIPNTAESAFYGLMEGISAELARIRAEKIIALGPNPSREDIEQILSIRPRFEKVAHKDEKLRTFITNDADRGNMVSHVYDVTYGLVTNEVDTLVVLDDSIVRGTTLKNSLIRILARLKPKKIIILSSAPQIRYPDCYGIDMSKIGEFVAFKAMIALLKERNMEHRIKEVYEQCKQQVGLPAEQVVNSVATLYDHFTDEEISQKIIDIVKPDSITPEVEIIYQTIDDLHKACTNHRGDWYFSGKYPTPGGNVIVNRAFINFYENNDRRAY